MLTIHQHDVGGALFSSSLMEASTIDSGLWSLETDSATPPDFLASASSSRLREHKSPSLVALKNAHCIE